MKDNKMIFEQYVLGPLYVNTFLIADPSYPDKPAAIIDPAGAGDDMTSFIKEAGLQPKYIINTHGHIDHIAFNKKFKDLYGADILIHENDAPWLGEQQDSELFTFVGASESPPADRLLRDGDEITIGDIDLKVIHTPGHTQGGISLRHNDFTLTGDTLFAGGVGRTDLPGGNYEQMIGSIRTRLLTLPEETVIYPGHGEESTIGDEIENNPFLQL